MTPMPNDAPFTIQKISDKGVIVRFLRKNETSGRDRSYEKQLIEVVEDHQHIVIDLSTVETISTAWIKWFIVMSKTSTKSSKEVVVAGPQGAVKELIDFVSLPGTLRLATSVEEAWEKQ